MNMTMKKYPLILLMLLLPAQWVFAETFALRSYYPAPYGAYQRLRLVPRAAFTGTSCPVGSLYVNTDDNDIIYYCNADDADGEWAPLPGVWTQNGDNIYLTDVSAPETKMVGIGTDIPELKLTLANDGGIIAHGEFGVDAALITFGGGARLIWYPRKAALLAGEVTGAQWDDANIGDYAVAFGLDNEVDGDKSVVAGGSTNRAATQSSVVAGGTNNEILSAGLSGEYAAIVGGDQNAIQGGTYSIIGGGGSNTITDAVFAVIGGGLQNSASANQAAIVGGAGNQIMMGSTYATIGGGQGNVITNNSLYSTIAGGHNNSIDGAQYGTIVGGGNADPALGNKVRADYALIIGGANNLASGIAALVGGGDSNTANGNYSTVIGGQGNTASGDWSSVFGGRSNTASGLFSVVGGGQNNSATNNYAAVGGGLWNLASGQYSFVGGGEHNTASGDYSVAAYGAYNEAAGEYSWAGGRHMRALGDHTFVWGYSETNDVDVTQDDAFIIYSADVGIGTITPQAKVHVDGSVQIDNGSLILTSAAPPGSVTLKRDPASKVIGRDLAEIFETTDEVEVGDVVVLDEEHPLKLRKSFQSNDQKVAGIVSQSPGLLFEGHQLQVFAQPFQNGHRAPVALSGRVRCKVSLENGPIRAGDLLTSSSTAGHAMKATGGRQAAGTIVGKALEAFEGGPDGETTGFLTVLVTLQ